MLSVIHVIQLLFKNLAYIMQATSHADGMFFMLWYILRILVIWDLSDHGHTSYEIIWSNNMS